MHILFPEEDGGVASFKNFKDISSFGFGLQVTSTLGFKARVDARLPCFFAVWQIDSMLLE